MTKPVLGGGKADYIVSRVAINLESGERKVNSKIKENSLNLK